MRRELVLLIILLLGIVMIASLVSCVLGYASRGMLIPPTPTPTPSPALSPPTIEQIRHVAELATVRYTLSTEVIGVHVPEDIRKEFGVKEELLLIAHGDIVAGFDLGELQDEDMWVDRSRVQLHLPAPKILYVRLDNQRTRVAYYDKSWIIKRDLDLESQTRAEAEEILRRAALEGEILEQASKYGEIFFSNWLRSMGFTEVQVIVG
jgi:hypothetical protein